MKIDKSQWYKEFYERLYNQYLYLCNGGTIYRIETAKISLQIAKNEKSIDPFLYLDQAINTVSMSFPNLDEERLRDVSKMLYVNANEVQRKNTVSKELKTLVDERMKNRKPIKLTKAKK